MTKTQFESYFNLYLSLRVLLEDTTEAGIDIQQMNRLIQVEALITNAPWLYNSQGEIIPKVKQRNQEEIKTHIQLSNTEFIREAAHNSFEIGGIDIEP